MDDAVAVTPGSASRVVAAVRRLIEEGTPCRADALAVLIYVLDHAYVYRDLRPSERTYRGACNFGIAEEEAVHSMMCDEYKPSRHKIAPFSPFAALS
ncbi:hypothetical protein ACIBMZ_30525 [Micromonospora sp. NPDC049900]|uniref:hypothetical protein n=1 Tax=Micromonospora sp. NPDC049900 TaxID=3364275 RepID=UPI003796E5A3